MNSLFAFLLSPCAFWDGCEGGVTCLSTTAMSCRAFCTNALRLTSLRRICGLFHSFLIALSITACFFLASCVIIFTKSTSFLVNGFVVNFIIPYLKLLLFFIGSYHFSIYRLKSMFMQFYIYFPINLLYNHIRKRVYSAINLQNKPL